MDLHPYEPLVLQRRAHPPLIECPPPPSEKEAARHLPGTHTSNLEGPPSQKAFLPFGVEAGQKLCDVT